MERAQALLQNLAEFFQMPLPETVRHISVCAILELNEFFDSLFFLEIFYEKLEYNFLLYYTLNEEKITKLEG